MEFISTRACLEELVLDIGSVKVEQLVRFFRDAKNAEDVPYFIQQFIAKHIFDYDQVRNEVSAHNVMPEREATIRRRILAFWVVAYFGFANIKEVHVLKYPSQLLFITEANKTYDLTICTSVSEATSAMRMLRLFDGPVNDINHIAILQSTENKELCDAVLACGFDSYCVLDEDKVPHYFTKEGSEK